MCKLVLLLMLPVLMSTAKDPLKPKLSKKPLTAEQIEVYRAFLNSYLERKDASLNISDVTDPLTPSIDDLKEGEGCLKDIHFENFKEANSTVHRLDTAIAVNPNIKLVDPVEQSKQVKKNDPQTVIRKNPGSADIEATVKQAFETGLFTLSEIAFDKEHHLAVLSYSFHCGVLCGHGGTIILEKVDGKWKGDSNRYCSNWVS